jgi:hypothetical protein
MASVIIILFAPPHALEHRLQGVDNPLLPLLAALLLGDLALFFLLGMFGMSLVVRMLLLRLHVNGMRFFVLVLGVLGTRRTCPKRNTKK